MRYVIVCGDFRHGGGMERPNYELARYLAETEDAETHLVAYHVATELASLRNVTWHKVAKPLDSYFLAATLLSRRGRQVAREVTRQGPCRVVVNGGNCPWADVNWVHYVHAAYRPQVATGRAWHAKTVLSHRKFLRDEKRALHQAKLVIADSEQTRREIIELIGIPAERVQTVYYGIDSEIFRPLSPEERHAARAALGWHENRLTAVFVGALGDRRKGFDVLFEAWQELCRTTDWDVDLVAAGAGAEISAWRRHSEVANLGSKVRLLGFTDNIRQILGASDVLISPTRYEPYGLAVHEALCCGIPAFVTRTAGVAERYPLELRDLLLDAPPDAANVAQSLRHWRVAVEDFRARTSMFGAKLRQHSWSDAAREMVELLGA